MNEDRVEISHEGIVFCGPYAGIKLLCDLWMSSDTRCSECPLKPIIDKL